MAEAVIDYPRGVTFEEVWAALKKTEQLVKENAERQKETDQQMKETDRRMKKTEEFLESIGKQMGGLHRNFGELAEHLVLPGIIERFNRFGYHFDAAFSRGLKIYDGNKKMLAEVDMLLMNGNCLMAVEVKATVVSKDIGHHVRRMEILRDFYNKQNDRRKICGCIAGAMFEEPDKQAAVEAGFYVIEQSGDTMRIAVPEGFVPREW